MLINQVLDARQFGLGEPAIAGQGDRLKPKLRFHIPRARHGYAGVNCIRGFRRGCSELNQSNLWVDPDFHVTVVENL